MARILLAEDDDSMRSFIAKALERSGHEVVACADGEAALEAFEVEELGHYDLLLTDIVMPGVDGIELARRTCEMDPFLRVLFVTGYAAVALNTPDEARVLSKPFHLRQLADEVQDILQGDGAKAHELRGAD